MELDVQHSGILSRRDQAASQGGILEGQNPTHYDPKNPV